MEQKLQESDDCRQAGVRGNLEAHVRPSQGCGRLQSLFGENGVVHISLPEGSLPEFLIKANDAIKAGMVERAARILSERDVDLVRQLTARDPSRTDVMFVLARLFYDTGQLDKAEHWYRKTLEQEAHALVYNDLASICVRDPKRLSEAVGYGRKASELAPDNVEFIASLGRNLMGVGQIDEGIGLLRKAADLAPDSPIVGSILLWNLHYLPGQTRKMFYDQYRQWGQTYAPMSASKRSYQNVPDPDRKLRIGYVSPDFHMHSAAHSFEPFLDGYDRDKLQVYGYGYVTRPDETTKRLEQKFDCYRDIHAMHYEKTARLIEQDEIDILVEMGGHSDNNCLGVLKYKPAPIQVDHGGIDTSGMEQIDYRLTDELLDPPHLQKFYVEQSICLPGGLASFRPARVSPLVSPLPAKRNGYVTFGSFNNNIKISDDIMSLWAQILNATDDSCLVLKFIAGGDQGARDRYFRKLAQLGIDRERVKIYGTMPHFEHLRLLGQVDIALDTYPYNGCITTLEGLWMGVPTVTLVGEHYVSRVGYSVLSRVGLGIFAASTPQEYVAKAVAFAGQLENLAAIRASLRQRLLESDLCDPRRLAREIEAAFRKMWYRWCHSQGVSMADRKPKRAAGTLQSTNIATQCPCGECGSS